MGKVEINGKVPVLLPDEIGSKRKFDTPVTHLTVVHYT